MSLIADIVVSSAAAAFAHFGFTLDVPDREPRIERTVARTQVERAMPAPAKAQDCPDERAKLHRI